MYKVIPLMFLFCGCNIAEIMTVEKVVEEIIREVEQPENYPPEMPRGSNGLMQR